MINKAKLDKYSLDNLMKDEVHIVGCGSIGSHLAELFARQGAKSIHLWDFDIVSSHNITNQMFRFEDIDKAKVDAVESLMLSINPELSIVKHNKGWNNEPMPGYIFMCVDSIEIRKAIVKTNEYNPLTKAFFDFRTRLFDAQHYAADRTNKLQMKAIKNSMDFTREEAKESTTLSACGVEMNVVDVVKLVTSVGFANFRGFLLGKSLHPLATVNVDTMTFEVY